MENYSGNPGVRVKKIESFTGEGEKDVYLTIKDIFLHLEKTCPNEAEEVKKMLNDTILAGYEIRKNTCVWD